MTHPRWKTLRDKLTKGCEYPVGNLIEEVRMADLKENLEKGNHKSIKRNECVLGKTMKKKVENGWGVLLPEDDVASIPGLEISPMGVAGYLGINVFGEYILKERVTHDLSFPGIKSKKSVNSRIDKTKLEPIIFGHCLIRLIRQIVVLQNEFHIKNID